MEVLSCVYFYGLFQSCKHFNIWDCSVLIFAFACHVHVLRETAWSQLHNVDDILWCPAFFSINTTKVQKWLKNLLHYMQAKKKFLLASLADWLCCVLRTQGVRASRARGTLRVPGPLKAAKNPGGD